MAYFDNAATTFPKPEIVYQMMDLFYRNHGGSAGRGNHELSKTTTELISETRNQLRELLHCPAKDVVFTPTDTIALNMIIQGLIKAGIRNVYITPFEHNAVTRTLHAFEKKGIINVFELSIKDNLELDFDRIHYQFDNTSPDLLIASHASNVLGLIIPVVDLFSLAKEYGSITALDMAQTAGLIDIDIGSSLFDFAVFAGHKTLYGPTGISGFVMNPQIDLPPVLFGGTGYDSANQDMPDSVPERYEMGTLNTSGIAGLNAALKWISETRIETIWDVECRHREQLLSILSGYEFIQLVGIYPENQYTGIVSCLIEGISSDSAASVFDRCGVAVRTGLQCAPSAHKVVKTYPAGTVRISVSFFTDDNDFRALKSALDYIKDNL